MKTIFSILFALFVGQEVEPLTGVWKGIAESNGYQMPFYMELIQSGSSVSGIFVFAQSDVQIYRKYVSGYVGSNQIFLACYIDEFVTLYFQGVVFWNRSIYGTWTVWTKDWGNVETEPWIVHKQDESQLYN